MVSMSMNALYPITTLSKEQRSIRLLHIEAPPAPDSLRGTLEVAHLSDSPTFTALSYVWGDPSTTSLYHISIDGTSLPITKTCHEALTSLRDHFGPLTIWVNSICIRQDDNAEESTQI